MSGQIYMVDPMCQGFEHVQFNAPLVLSALLAYPDTTVRFLAAESHCDHMRTSLQRFAPDAAARVQWETVPIPARTLQPLSRMRQEHRLLNRIFRQARGQHARAIVFASATDTAVISAKALMLSTHPGCPVVMVLHSVMVGLEQRARPFGPWRGISLALSLPRPKGVQFIVPAISILEYLAQQFPRLAKQFRAIDHPFFFNNPAQAMMKPTGVVRFGYFGVSAVKGFDVFARIAAELKAEGIPAEYSMIGHLNNPADELLDLTAVPDAQREPLTPEEYVARARNTTSAVWTAHAHHSGLVASSTFVDALSSLTPVVYIGNHLLDTYARTLGDFGYRCSNEQDLKSTMRRLSLEWPNERYRRQQEAMLVGRKIFDPASVSMHLRTIIEEVRNDQ